jgi:hypothetical protein
MREIASALGDKLSLRVLWLGSPVMAHWWVGLLLLLVGTFGGMLLAIGISREALPTVALILAPVVTLCFWPSRVCVAGGVLHVSWLLWTRTARLSEIRSMQARTTGNIHWLELTLSGGDTLRVGGLTRYDVDDLESEITRSRAMLGPPTG